jgi:uncharacterized C2H2 Zn-finger protein
MSAFIKKKFPTDIPQIAHISVQIHANQYDLIRDNGIVIDEDFWDDIIQPGWTVELKLWPLEALTGGGLEQNEPPSSIETPTASDTVIPPAQDPPTNNPDTEIRTENTSNTSPSPIQEPISEPDASQQVTPPAPEQTGVSTEAEEEPLLNCPVCLKFQGTKKAINRHVNTRHYFSKDENAEKTQKPPQHLPPFITQAHQAPKKHH